MGGRAGARGKFPNRAVYIYIYKCLGFCFCYGAEDRPIKVSLSSRRVARDEEVSVILVKSIYRGLMWVNIFRIHKAGVWLLYVIVGDLLF